MSAKAPDFTMCLGHCAQHAGPVIGAALSMVGVGSNGGKQTREGGRGAAAAAAAPPPPTVASSPQHNRTAEPSATAALMLQRGKGEEGWCAVIQCNLQLVIALHMELISPKTLPT